MLVYFYSTVYYDYCDVVNNYQEHTNSVVVIYIPACLATLTAYYVSAKGAHSFTCICHNPAFHIVSIDSRVEGTGAVPSTVLSMI